MKVCIVFQNSYVHMGHAMALELRDRYGVELCGYIFSDYATRFLREQQDISYTGLLSDTEIHEHWRDETLDFDYLTNLEKEYGLPNLWPYLYVDRKLMSSIPPKEYNGKHFDLLYPYEDLLRIVQSRFRMIISFFDKEKPDGVVLFTMGSLAQSIIHQICKLRGIKVLNIDLTRTAHRMAFSEHYNTLTGVEEIFEEIRAGKRPNKHRAEVADFLAEFRKTGNLNLEFFTKANPKDRFLFLHPRNILNAFRFMGRLVAVYFIKGSRFEYSYADTDPVNYVKHKILLKLRGLRGFEDLYYTPQNDEQFAFFPLHVEPEVALLQIAPYYTDQIHLIRQIARSLPISFKLLVKEHPAMLNYRSRKYYKQLLEIPNVRLVSPYLKAPELAQRAQLTLVITGTVGWEAVLARRPVVTFGNVYFNKLSFVKRCRDIEQLPYLVKEQIEHFAYDEEELIDFLGSLWEDSVEFDFFRLWHMDVVAIREDKGFENFMEKLASKLLPKSST